MFLDDEEEKRMLMEFFCICGLFDFEFYLIFLFRKGNTTGATASGDVWKIQKM